MTYATPKSMTSRDEAHAGQYLKWYEAMRYTPAEKIGYPSIIVPPDAEQFADVSFWQVGMDWAEYKKHARAVILRIGQNVWEDVEFENNYREARRNELLIGGYFFFDGRATPVQQAEVIINAMQGKYFELELFIDWEHNYGGQSEGLPNVVKLMQLVEAEGVKCKAVGMYTGYFYMYENSNASANGAQYTYLKSRPLWIAWYASASVVKVPAPWSDWTHWQYGTPAVQWGQPSAEIDMNRHNGTAAEFTARYGGVTPPTGDPIMQQATVRGASSLKVREGPSVTFRQIEGLWPGDIAFGRLDTATNWFNLSSITRANGRTLTINGWCSAAYLTVAEVPPVDPPVDPPAEPADEIIASVDMDVAVKVNGIRYTGTVYIGGVILKQENAS